jgi:hypothetical protein
MTGRRWFALFVWCFAGFIVVVGIMGAQQARAIGGAALFATHPSVASQPIPDMAVRGDRLYLAFGDWDTNTGPIDAAWVSMSTGATGSDVSMPTEATNTLRTYGSDVLAPWVDPRGGGTPGGYTLNGVNRPGPVMVHTFDVARYGSDVFMVGSCYDVGACVFRNGTLSLRETSSGGKVTGYERFYWIREAGGKLYAQAYHKDWPTSGGLVIVDANRADSYLFPMRVWDGTRWVTASKRASVGAVYQGKSIESFAGRLWTTSGKVTDGKRATSSGAPFRFADLYPTADRLYGIASDGRVAYTTGSAWTTLPGTAVPAGVRAQSVVVHDGWVYIGSDGSVWRSAL